MAFKVAAIFQALDGDASTHRTTIKTSTIEITTVITRLNDLDQTVQACTELVQNQGVQSLILTPDFTYQEVAKVSTAVEGKAGVFVARADIPTILFTEQLLIQGGWFPIGP